MSFFVSLGIVVVGLLLIASILKAIVKKRIAESHGLLWLIPGLLIIYGGLFPDSIVHLARHMNVSYAPTLVFTFAILTAYYLLFWCTMWIGAMSMRMQELGIQVSLLNEENERLNAVVKSLAGDPGAPEENEP